MKVIDLVMLEHEFHQNFEKEFYEELDSDYATCEMMKQFELVDLKAKNFTPENMKKYESKL